MYKEYLELRSIIVVILVTALQFVTSCKKEVHSGEAVPVMTGAGKVTPAGVPDGNIISKIISKEGGIVISEDGNLKIEIPAGAIEAAQTISIQPVTNLAPGGINKGYRITPHNIAFLKPVTIRFNYSDSDLSGTLPDFLGIAYQNQQGIWMQMNASEVNTTTHSIQVATTHFSDWTLFQELELVPAEAALMPGAELELKLLYHNEELLVPIASKPETPLGDTKEIGAEYIKKWTLAGDGMLISRSNHAWYTAPLTAPDVNPVAITAEVDLKKKGKYLLVANVTIIEEGITIHAGAGDGAGSMKLTGPSGASFIRSSGTTRLFGYGKNDGAVKQYVELSFTGKGSGSPYSWNRNKVIYLTYRVMTEDKITAYESFWSNSIKWFDSPGSIVINKYGQEGEYITGSFSASMAGYEKGGQIYTDVSGSFRVRYNGESAN